jgi:hypothetical protein
MYLIYQLPVTSYQLPADLVKYLPAFQEVKRLIKLQSDGGNDDNKAQQNNFPEMKELLTDKNRKKKKILINFIFKDFDSSRFWKHLVKDRC